MRFDKNSNLDELFASAAQPAIDGEKADIKAKEIDKDDDIRTINKEAAELSKEFERENREMLEQMRREEKEEERRKKEEESVVEEIPKQPDSKSEGEAQPNEGIEPEIENKTEEGKEENNQPAVNKKSKKSLPVRLMTFMAIPFIVIGFVMIWNCFIEEVYVPTQMNTVIMIIALAFYALAVVSVVSAFKTKHSVGGLFKIIGIGLLSSACAVLAVIYRAEIGSFLLLTCGIFGVIMAFIYLLFAFLAYAKKNKEDRKFPVFKVIMSCFALGAAVLLIVANFVTDETFVSVAGIITCVSGTAMFAA